MNREFLSQQYISHLSPMGENTVEITVDLPKTESTVIVQVIQVFFMTVYDCTQNQKKTRLGSILILLDGNTAADNDFPSKSKCYL